MIRAESGAPSAVATDAPPARLDSEAIWQDVECGSYRADLRTWRRLASKQRDGRCRLLDLGCGTGRVSLALAAAGCQVTALDSEPELVAELRRRATAGGIGLDTVVADARSFDLGRRFDLVLAPMQLVQLMESQAQRESLLSSIARHLDPGGRAALALLDFDEEWVAEPARPPLADVLERDGWVFSSQPLAVRGRTRAIELERLRQAVSPSGDLSAESLQGATGRRQCRRARTRGFQRRAWRRTGACASPPLPTTSAAPWSCSVQMPDLSLRVLWLYPEHMNIYADRGNIAVLERRCSWRGIGFELARAGLGDRVDPDGHDLLYVGGGQDSDQVLVARDMVETKREALAEAVAGDTALLAVCGGYQLLGGSYALPDGELLPGLGLVELETVREPGPRLIGNVVIEVDLGDGARRLAGFENHGGRTYLGEGQEPLGRVVKGFGNNGRDGAEGVRHRRLIGTYLHGPLLPKNVWLADRLIAWGLERRHGSVPALEPLDDELEAAAHRSALEAALGKNA